MIEFQGRKKNSITELILADTLASHLRGSFFNFALVLQENALVFSQSETRSYFFHIHFQVPTNIVPCADDFTCTNGCCKNNPCLNRGTCTEICQPTSVRYNCSCPVPFVGKHCEIQQKRSCQDYKAAGSTASGLYTVNDDNNQTFQVFCDLDSEPGFAWNLIESFSLSNKHRFQVFAFSLNPLQISNT